MTTCQRCGRCCHYIKDGKTYKCGHLVKMNDKYFCRNFNGRLKSTVRKGVKCILRKDSVYDYVGCPFNTGKEISDVWRELE